MLFDMQVTRYSDDVIQAQRTHGGIVHRSHFEGPQNMNQMRSPFMEKGEVCSSFLQKELNTIV